MGPNFVLADASSNALEALLGVATTDSCRHRFLDWIAAEIRAELSRRKRGGAPVALPVSELPLPDLGAGVGIADIFARRFSQHAAGATSEGAFTTLVECVRLSAGIGVTCLRELDRRTPQFRSN